MAACLPCPPIFIAFHLFSCTHSPLKHIVSQLHCLLVADSGTRFLEWKTWNHRFHSSLCLSSSLYSPACCPYSALLSVLDPCRPFIPPLSIISHFVCLFEGAPPSFPPSFHSSLPPSPLLIYSPSTHAHLSLVRAAWNYLLLNGLQPLTKAHWGFALFIDFHSFCLSKTVCGSDCVRVQDKHILKDIKLKDILHTGAAGEMTRLLKDWLVWCLKASRALLADLSGTCASISWCVHVPTCVCLVVCGCVWTTNYLQSMTSD